MDSRTFLSTEPCARRASNIAAFFRFCFYLYVVYMSRFVRDYVFISIAVTDFKLAIIRIFAVFLELICLFTFLYRRRTSKYEYETNEFMHRKKERERERERESVRTCVRLYFCIYVPVSSSNSLRVGSVSRRRRTRRRGVRFLHERPIDSHAFA